LSLADDSIKQNKTKKEGRLHMKAICRLTSAGGEGSVRVNSYRPKGLRNKRKSIWSNQRKTAEMVKKMRERQETRQNDYDEDINFED
jgi:hypothetical protein